MAVPARRTQLLVAEASNAPGENDLTLAEINNYMRNQYGFMAQDDATATLASGTSIDLGAQTARTVKITHSTGTTAITSFGTAADSFTGSLFRLVRFSITGGTLSITHNATSLILPGAANITLRDGDVVVTENTGSGNWIVYALFRRSVIPYDANLPVSTTTTTAVLADRGKINFLTAGMTIPASIFSAGDVLVLYNNSASSITLTQGAGLTLRLGGVSATGNRTLAARGICNCTFVSATQAVVSGSGLS